MRQTPMNLSTHGSMLLRAHVFVCTYVCVYVQVHVHACACTRVLHASINACVQKGMRKCDSNRQSPHHACAEGTLAGDRPCPARSSAEQGHAGGVRRYTQPPPHQFVKDTPSSRRCMSFGEHPSRSARCAKLLSCSEICAAGGARESGQWWAQAPPDLEDVE